MGATDSDTSVLARHSRCGEHAIATMATYAIALDRRQRSGCLSDYPSVLSTAPARMASSLLTIAGQAFEARDAVGRLRPPARRFTLRVTPVLAGQPFGDTGGRRVFPPVAGFVSMRVISRHQIGLALVRQATCRRMLRPIWWGSRLALTHAQAGDRYASSNRPEEARLPVPSHGP